MILSVNLDSLQVDLDLLSIVTCKSPGKTLNSARVALMESDKLRQVTCSMVMMTARACVIRSKSAASGTICIILGSMIPGLKNDGGERKKKGKREPEVGME